MHVPAVVTPKQILLVAIQCATLLLHLVVLKHHIAVLQGSEKCVDLWVTLNIWVENVMDDQMF